jgi:diguanylate cyclase (GGDEF)-like protein
VSDQNRHRREAVNYLAKIEQQHKPLLILLGFTAIGVIGIIDFMTGYELAFSVFYVLPISLVTWLANRWTGLLASLVSAVVWFSADMATGHFYSNSFIPIWNTLIRFAFFIIIAFLLSALRNAMQRESELARIDYLTGVVNLRFFSELVQMEIDRLERYGRPFTLAYFDLDNFKFLNDRFGHSTGDQVLSEVASCVRRYIRKTDIFARIGGDEFVLFLPETNPENARIALPKIKNELLMDMQQNNWSITFSIGVLTCNVAPGSVEELVKYADELMYEVKHHGKNGIEYSIFKG